MNRIGITGLKNPIIDPDKSSCHNYGIKLQDENGLDNDLWITCTIQVYHVHG